MLGLTKLEIYIVAAVIVLLAAGGAFAFAYHKGVAHERMKWEAKEAAATKADLASLADAVKAGADIAQKTFDRVQSVKAGRVIDRGVIEREIKTDVRYVSDCFPDTGRVQWNAVNAGRTLVPGEPAGAKPDAALPAGARAGGGGLQRRDAAPQSP